MDIIGAVLFILLPYAAGYVCKRILRWRETNQIETYLIGFFFLFFLQGVILIPCVWLNKGLTQAATLFLIVAGALVFLALLFFVWKWAGKKKVAVTGIKVNWKKTDKVVFSLSILVFAAIIVRMILGMNLLRTDVTLETVLTAIESDALFKIHPLTGYVMEAGMITSKKIVTLPLFYACVAKLIGMDAAVFVYLVVGVMVLLCSYYAGALLLSKVTMSTRGKLYTFWLVYGLMLLSGDYHGDTLAYRLLYRGYDGTSICFGVILPYLLYLIISWYKLETGEESVSIGSRMTYVLRLFLGFAVSIVISGLGTGFVFLFMATVIAGFCCLLKSIKEVRACRE